MENNRPGSEAKEQGIDLQEVQAALDREALANVKAIAPVLAWLFAIYTGAHYFMVPVGSREIMMAVAGTSALTFFWFSWGSQRSVWSPHWAIPIMAGFFAIVGFNSLLHLWLVAEPRLTTNLLLLVLGGSWLIIDGRWFGWSLVSLVLGWVGVVILSPPSEEWAHFAIAMASVSLIAVVVHRLHVKQLVRLEGLHLRDLRQQEKLQLAVSAAEASSHSKSQFLAHMSHELRTPLNSIIGFTGLLIKNKEGHLQGRDLKFLDRIRKNGQHLLGLIDQVLDLSRIEAESLGLEVSSQDLSELIAEVVALLKPVADEKGLELVAKIPPGVWTMILDPGRFRQVLINLVSNGLKFTEQGGVELYLEVDSQGVAPVSLVVADTGIGIPQEHLESIFQAFEQVDQGAGRKFGGTGLGLTITRRLCEQMEIPIRVDSEVGRGTVFTLDLKRVSRS